MALFRFSWFPDFYDSLEELRDSAMAENWDYIQRPTGKIPVLANYVHHTFQKIQAERKIEYKGDFCCLNTGLVTENQEEIYGYFQKNKKPQFYNGKLQLLLPLCLLTKSKADLAMVIDKENNVYRASTCLTLDMAINNARLIAKPDDEWLKI